MIAQILIAEDNDIDAERIMRSARRAGLPNPIIWATDGQEALDILRGEDDRGPLSAPYVVLLDLNMPRMNGFEFLSALRSDPEFSGTYVVILTTSDMPSDHTEAERLGANGYLIKPITPEQLAEIVASVERDRI